MRVLRIKQTRDRVGGLTDQWLRKLEERGQFPRRIRLGPNSVGHLEHEVDEWLAARAAERDALARDLPAADDGAKPAARAKRRGGGAGAAA